MNRADLIRQLAEKFHPLTANDVELSVRAILDEMSYSMVKGGRIEIRGFGSFNLNYRPPRKGRKPLAGGHQGRQADQGIRPVAQSQKREKECFLPLSTR